MKVLLGGMGALIIGFIGLIAWWGHFLQILKGSIPLMLILAGFLAIYLGVEEVKHPTPPSAPIPAGEKKPE